MFKSSLFHVKHNSRKGRSIPSIAFGTWKMGNGQNTVDLVEQALSVGFDHIGQFSFQF